jgi:ABC-type transport system substrate-binding protein
VTDARQRAQRAWAAFAANPSGTGPFRGVRLVPRERFEMVRNPNYWDPARTPKIDRVVLLPLPEANARTAALLGNQVDWIEAPAPDAVAAIRQRGFTLYQNPQPHVWPWQFSFLPNSPFLDRRVRHAANLCINREELRELLGGLMGVPKGTVPPGHPWWGNPELDIRYDLAAARRLMTEAGFAANRRLTVKVLTSASGSGQMQPVAMNEWLQQALRECYFDVQLEVIEWNALFTNWREGANHANARGAHAINVTYAAMDPFFAMVRFVTRGANPPNSNNWGFFNSDEMETLVQRARTSFDGAARDAALAALHKRIVEEAPFLWVAHDVGPRAMSPRVTGVVQPRSWFIDLATMDIRN